MPNAREVALRRRAELVQEIEKIDLFIDLYDRFSGVQDLETSELSSNIAPIADPAFAAEVGIMAGQPRTRAKGNPKPAQVVQEVRELLLEKNEPLTRRQILDELTKRGLIIMGSDPMKVLGTNLWRSEAFVQLEGFGYWPKDRPFTQAGYRPSSEPPF